MSIMPAVSTGTHETGTPAVKIAFFDPTTLHTDTYLLSEEEAKHLMLELAGLLESKGDPSV